MNDIIYVRLEQLLKLHEGFSRYWYKDVTGHTTIGYGRNLDAKGITKSEARVLLADDIDDAVADARKIDFFEDLSLNRRIVILDMLFNMGLTKVMDFRKMIEAIREKDFELAAEEMLASKWANQVGTRALRLAEIMRSNKWPDSL